jgi:hypothetical protein
MNIKIERIFLRELVLSIIIKYLLREIGFEFSIERIFLRELVLSIIIKYLLREIGFEFTIRVFQD